MNVVNIIRNRVRQKRLQGSHGANDEQANACNQLVIDGKIDQCLSDVYSFEDIGKAHQDMEEGKNSSNENSAIPDAADIERQLQPIIAMIIRMPYVSVLEHRIDMAWRIDIRQQAIGKVVERLRQST